MRLRRQAERAVVSGHYRIDLHRFLPKQCGREMNCVEGAQLRRRRLRGAIQHDRVDFDQFERINQT